MLGSALISVVRGSHGASHRIKAHAHRHYGTQRSNSGIQENVIGRQMEGSGTTTHPIFPERDLGEEELGNFLLAFS